MQRNLGIIPSLRRSLKMGSAGKGVTGVHSTGEVRPTIAWLHFASTRNVLWSRASVFVSVCMCLSVRGRMPSYCTDPDVIWGNGRECPLVVHYWANLQSVHGLRCYGNITRTQNVSEYMLVLALRVVVVVVVRL